MDSVDFAEARGKFMYLDKCPITFYQENCRIYLDEYPEVEEWDYLPIFDNTVLMKRFMVRE